MKGNVSDRTFNERETKATFILVFTVSYCVFILLSPGDGRAVPYHTKNDQKTMIFEQKILDRDKSVWNTVCAGSTHSFPGSEMLRFSSCGQRLH